MKFKFSLFLSFRMPAALNNSLALSRRILFAEVLFASTTAIAHSKGGLSCHLSPVLSTCSTQVTMGHADSRELLLGGNDNCS